jgi:hypothetical protein
VVSEDEVEVMSEAKGQAGAFEQHEEGASSGSHMQLTARHFTCSDTSSLVLV